MPSALAVFTCRPNSHPFQERHVYLDEPVKIGRSVARCRPAQNNATFDCKVLSRNHALVWFDHKTGKFYLQDTKSSNGTFINSQRLSRGSEESPPCEVLSGDIIQFGVDVTENTRKVTHGCIVSTIKLFLPDGMEARRRSDVIQAPLPLPVDKVAANTPSMYSQELFQLSQYLQEALHREQMLEQKLATLQRLLASTQEASESSWQALIDEDRLLSRLEVMGNQLQAYSKNQTEDGIRKELVALQEDKHNYETTAKESLRRVLQEKIEVVRKLSEVERSLSNTEDECTHLKEMNERTQEELRELANKYNGAVNEIKDLTDKIKLAEGRQEELTQKGQSEKKELQLRIEEMEEKEQALQARIEALQADNDFTNERLTALQVRLEQLQEKNIKENNSLEHFLLKSGGDCTFIQQFIECQPVKQLKEAVDSSLTKISNFDEVIDAHLQNNQMSDENSLDSPERLKAKLIDDGHHQNVMDENKLVKENQIDAKESDMSDTLSPSKDKSSDDTSDGQMDEQELNEPLNKVALLKDELRRANLEPGDTEQVIQHLHRELLEAQELANTGKQKCVELQALLEEERRTNKQQTEDSAKQIQFLQAQLQKLQADMEVLREQRESAISSTREELYSAQEEVLMLRHAMETANAEREREIAALQGDLGAVTAELEKWRQAAAKYEMEISTLQASFQQQSQHREKAAQLQGELERLQKECSSLQKECTSLRSEKVALLEKLQQLEVELDSSREQSATLRGSLNALEKSQGDLESKLGSMQDQHMQDASKLKTQLAQADSRTKSLQKEYEDTQTQLLDLRERYERTEQEKRSINDELEQCKVNLKLLQEKGNNSGWLPWMPVVAVMVAVTAVVLYPGLSKSST
ncbi:sarcolemma associated protein a isoform X10 [Megalops cyprinoides]|uniref:sarcolemma associated protein a isoform X10 n=1 Tax=Megalops cyprinoides TaxID=118141 RepID=UPI001864F1EF|nr:sarcolemma associated protein a isoform X10 [Megalops cyprinoides]